MSTYRALAASAATAAFVYAIFLSKSQFSLAGLANSDSLILASACLISSALVLVYARMSSEASRARAVAWRWPGWVLFSSGMIVYVLSVASAYPTFMRWVSLWVLLPGVAILLLGPKNFAFAAPGLSFLFLFVPPLPSQSVAEENALIVLLAVSTLLMASLSESFPTWTRPLIGAPFVFEVIYSIFPGYSTFGALGAVVAISTFSAYLLLNERGTHELVCALDDLPLNSGHRGCANCGRPLNGPKRSDAGKEAAVLGVMLVVAVIALTVSVPLVSVDSGDIRITTYTAGQSTSTAFMTAPVGFLQNSSLPSPTLEKLYSEPFVVIKEFFPQLRPENYSYRVYLEVSAEHTFLVKHWQYLGGYNRTTETTTVNGSSPAIIYSTLLRANGTAFVAVSYEVPATVLMNGQFTKVNVGVSALAFPSFNVTQQGYEAIKNQMISQFFGQEAKLSQASAWTDGVSAATSTLTSAVPYAGLGAGTTATIGILGLVLRADRDEQRLLDSIDGLGRDDQIILATAVRLGMHRRPKAGSDLYLATGSTLTQIKSVKDFCGRLRHLEDLGYLRQEPRPYGNGVRFLWHLRAP